VVVGEELDHVHVVKSATELAYLASYCLPGGVCEAALVRSLLARVSGIYSQVSTTS
jgi:hypothetical protein